MCNRQSSHHAFLDGTKSVLKSILSALVILVAFLFFASWPNTSIAADYDYQQLAGVLDTRSQFSDGIYTIDGLAKLAQDRGVQVLFINDHDKMALSYGVPFLSTIIAKTVKRNAILNGNPEDYLQAIRQAEEKYKNILIIPGTESSPFYYWSGNPLQNNLTAHDYERRILTVGLTKPDDYGHMPVVHNSGVFNILRLPALIPFLISLLAASVLIIWRGILRIAGIVLVVISLLFIIENHPFRASSFDPFHGPQGMLPYQELIDYVRSRGGLTFWNYPETRSGVRKLGPIQVSTKPYPEVLMASKGYTGFAALYGDNITLTEPGNIWDMALQEFCKGYRQRPPWGVATADYHKEGEGGEVFGNFQTVFLVRDKSKKAVLAAMENGKMYARRGKYPLLASLDEFSIADEQGGPRGLSGDNVTVKNHARIRISIKAPAANLQTAGQNNILSVPNAAAAATPPAQTNNTATNTSTPPAPTNPVLVRLIRNGVVINTFEGPLPLNVDYIDPYFRPGEKTYYRMDMQGFGRIVANPIFVTFSGA